MYTTAHVWAPAGLRGACSELLTSRELARDQVAPSRAKHGNGNPNIQRFPLLRLCRICITPSLQLSSSLLCDSHGATAVAHQALPFSTATDDASACAGEHAMFSVFGGNRNEHAVQLRRHCRQVFNRAICNDFLVVLFVKFP